MMIERSKHDRQKYPDWLKRKRRKSTPQLCRERDNNKCVDCPAIHRTTYTNAEGEPSMYFLHASHLSKLDPEYYQLTPINGQRVKTRCPKCHRVYDIYWKAREAELEHQRILHEIIFTRRKFESSFLARRFMTVL
jgi:hypothetical protein